MWVPSAASASPKLGGSLAWINITSLLKTQKKCKRKREGVERTVHKVVGKNGLFQSKVHPTKKAFIC